MSESVPVKRENQTQAPAEGQVVSPWRESGDMFRDVDTVFNRMVRNFFDMPMGMNRSMGTQSFTPAVDIEETDNEYILDVDLPGVSRDHINIEAGQQDLRIHGDITERERTGVLRHRTRRTGSFDYRVALPRGIDLEKISSRYSDGVLTVMVPRSEMAKPRRVKVD